MKPYLIIMSVLVLVLFGLSYMQSTQIDDLKTDMKKNTEMINNSSTTISTIVNFLNQAIIAANQAAQTTTTKK